MSEIDDIDDFAAEYVLGTLDDAERRDVAARRVTDATLNEAIIAWETRLGPLAETIPSVAAPDGAFDLIQRRLTAPAGANDNVVDLRRRLGRWRFAAISTGALAACLAIGIAVWPMLRPPAGSFVAVLQKDAASPAFLISVNMDTRVLTVRPVAAPPEPGRSYELWLVNAKLGGPRSLGVIDDRATSIRQASTYDRATVEDATYAVSLEPAGGSPTGAPTGPVLFTGKLISAKI
jgi:anti-sigma-K factor RskA